MTPPIKSVFVSATNHGQECHFVGLDGVTRIEACAKDGMHSEIPYVRVWKGEHLHSEHCQHNVLGVYFGEPVND